MRAYYFGNMYLSSIQQGIQAAHVPHEPFTKYPRMHPHSAGATENYLWEWAENHKTMVLLNAGYGDEIRSLVEMFDTRRNPYPWVDFHEGQDSLDGALTCVGIILPEKIYHTGAHLRSLSWRDRADAIAYVINNGEIKIEDDEGKGVTYELSKWEFDFIQRLGNYGLAK